jgi:hypothetical protein
MLKNFIKSNPKLYVLAKKLSNHNAPKLKNFVSVGGAFDLLLEYAANSLNNSYDCIVGVPRAGGFFANVLASILGCGYATVEGYVRGEVYFANELKRTIINKVLVVDDSMLSGQQLKTAVDKVKAFTPGVLVESLVLFQTNGSKCIVPNYVLFKGNNWTFGSWNMLTSMGCIPGLGVDIDGVLAIDCNVEVTRDEAVFKKWLINVPSLFVPKFKVKAVVTSRHEKYRGVTEFWLHKHNVSYDYLVMGSNVCYDAKAASQVKIDAILNYGLGWFWESNSVEADLICKGAGVPVFCVGNQHLYVPSLLSRI